MTQPAISVTDLCKRYGSVLAVDHVNFEIQPGELVGFLGQNGAGKTTTMRILTTYMPASSGYARIAGHDVMYDSLEVRNNLGYLPESVPLYPEMRVDEYLQFRAKLKNVERHERRQRIDYCLDTCRIREVRRRLLGTLSKGYRQRVGLADSLIGFPKVLILDEPLSGLDPVQQEETRQAIRALGGERTVLFSSHHLPDVEKVCDRVIIIDRGKIRFDNKLSEIRKALPVLILELVGPATEIESFLKKTKNVAAVSRYDSAEPKTTRFEVHPQGSDDLRETLSKQIIERGWGIRHLELRHPRLEDTFMRVVFQKD